MVLGLAVSLILFFTNWQPDWPKLVVKPIWDLGHVGVFALWAALLAFLLKSMPAVKAAVVIGLGLLLLGGAVECLQPLFGRHAQWQDLGFDVLGITLGLLAYQCISGKKNRLRLLQAGLFVLLSVYLSKPLVMACYSLLEQQRRLPLIWQHSDTALLPIWFAGSSKHHLLEKGLEVEFNTKRYSTLEINAMPRDWRDYQALSFELEAKQAFKLTCRIHDRQHEVGAKSYRYHDRYTQGFNLQAGRQIITIDLARVRNAPLKREMHLGEIRKLICFSYQLQQPRTMLLHSIKFIP